MHCRLSSHFSFDCRRPYEIEDTEHVSTEVKSHGRLETYKIFMCTVNIIELDLTRVAVMVRINFHRARNAN